MKTSLTDMLTQTTKPSYVRKYCKTTRKIGESTEKKKKWGGINKPTLRCSSSLWLGKYRLKK